MTSTIEEEIELATAKDVVWGLFVLQYLRKDKQKWPRYGVIASEVGTDTLDILDRIGAKEARAEASRPGVA